MKKALMWIGGGVWVVIIAMALGVVSIPAGGDSKSPAHHAAVDALEGFYDAVYQQAKCWTLTTSDQTIVFARCGSEGSNIPGGLYIVRATEAGAEIYAVNGRAFQHVKDLSRLTGPDGAEYPVSRWSGEPIDIPAVLALF